MRQRANVLTPTLHPSGGDDVDAGADGDVAVGTAPEGVKGFAGFVSGDEARSLVPVGLQLG